MPLTNTRNKYLRIIQIFVLPRRWNPHLLRISRAKLATPRSSKIYKTLSTLHRFDVMYLKIKHNFNLNYVYYVK